MEHPPRREKDAICGQVDQGGLETPIDVPHVRQEVNELKEDEKEKDGRCGDRPRIDGKATQDNDREQVDQRAVRLLDDAVFPHVLAGVRRKLIVSHTQTLYDYENNCCK